MTAPLLHPESTEDPQVLRWLTGDRQLSDVPVQLSSLIDAGVLEDVEVGWGEVRTRLAAHRFWRDDGPTVRSALFEALQTEDLDGDLSDDELRVKIEEILAHDVAPITDAHGGAITVVSVADGVVTIELSGACLGCPMSGRTIGEVISGAVRGRYPQIRDIKTVQPRRSWRMLPLTLRSGRTGCN